MKHLLRSMVVTSLMLLFCAYISGCGTVNSAPTPSHSPDDTPRNTVFSFLVPESSGTAVYSNSLSSIDSSNCADGYIMIKYTGQSSKAKIRITIPDGVTYTYTLFGNEYRTFPLSGGDGIYQVTVYENVQDDMYAVVNSQTLNVSLTDEFVPFLYPNYYSWYTAETEAVQLGIQLSSHTYNDLEYLCEVYDYIISNITYDQELADSGPVDYVPDVDRTLNTGKGICFDYAALMTSMLRSQGIPTKLEVGYSGKVYHAWISVYLEETGWVDGIIQFDGQSWSLMDPTLAAGNSSKAVGRYIGDGSNYTLKYSY